MQAFLCAVLFWGCSIGEAGQVGPEGVGGLPSPPLRTEAPSTPIFPQWKAGASTTPVLPEANAGVSPAVFQQGSSGATTTVLPEASSGAAPTTLPQVGGGPVVPTLPQVGGGAVVPTLPSQESGEPALSPGLPIATAGVPFTTVLSQGNGGNGPSLGGRDTGSYLYQPAYELDDHLRGPAQPYEAQPGDIFLATDNAFWAQAGHRMAFSGPPHHSGIVFARPDGRLAILEAGPHNSVTVETVDLLDHLNSHHRVGEKVFIRRRRVPLTAEQSAKLTSWVLAQEGKPFAVLRLVAQITVFRTRGPLRTYFMGQPNGERDRYFCSELVLETCVTVGLLNAADVRPSATYPRDLFFDSSLNPFLSKHLNLSACWYPPARWTNHPVQAH